MVSVRLSTRRLRQFTVATALLLALGVGLRTRGGGELLTSPRRGLASLGCDVRPTLKRVLEFLRQTPFPAAQLDQYYGRVGGRALEEAPTSALPSGARSFSDTRSWVTDLQVGDRFEFGLMPRLPNGRTDPPGTAYELVSLSDTQAELRALPTGEIRRMPREALQRAMSYERHRRPTDRPLIILQGTNRPLPVRRPLAERWATWGDHHDRLLDRASAGETIPDEEAMAMLEGLADIATDLGYHARVIQDPLAVRLVRPGEPPTGNSELARYLTEFSSTHQAGVVLSLDVLLGRMWASQLTNTTRTENYLGLDLVSFINGRPSVRITEHEEVHVAFRNRARVAEAVAHLRSAPLPIPGRPADTIFSHLSARERGWREGTVIERRAGEALVRTADGRELWVPLSELAGARLGLPHYHAERFPITQGLRIDYFTNVRGRVAKLYEGYIASDEVEAYLRNARESMTRVRDSLVHPGLSEEGRQALLEDWTYTLWSVRQLASFIEIERAALRSILDRRLEPYEGPDLYFQLSRDQSVRLEDPLAPSGSPSRRANYARMRLRQRLRDLELAASEVGEMDQDFVELEPRVRALLGR